MKFKDQEPERDSSHPAPDPPEDVNTDGSGALPPEPQDSQQLPEVSTEGKVPKKRRGKQFVAQEPQEPLQQLKGSLARLYAKLENKGDLLKLHLKHYYMSARQFKFRLMS